MSSETSAPAPEVIDPRSPRFGAAITSVVLIVTLILGPTVWGVLLLLLQALAFAAGSILGLKHQPYGVLYRTLVRPRLQPPTEFEDVRPPRFAQGVGLAFAVAGLLGFVLSLPVLFYIAVGFALLAALLNAVFDFCLGCEIYLLGKRVAAKSKPAASEQ